MTAPTRKARVMPKNDAGEELIEFGLAPEPADDPPPPPPAASETTPSAPVAPTKEELKALLQARLAERKPMTRRRDGSFDPKSLAGRAYTMMLEERATNLEVTRALILEFNLPPKHANYVRNYRAHLVQWGLLTKEEAAARRGQTIPDSVDPGNLPTLEALFTLLASGAPVEEAEEILAARYGVGGKRPEVTP